MQLRLKKPHQIKQKQNWKHRHNINPEKSPWNCETEFRQYKKHLTVPLLPLLSAKITLQDMLQGSFISLMPAVFNPLAPNDAHTDFQSASFTFSCNLAIGQLEPFLYRVVMFSSCPILTLAMSVQSNRPGNYAVYMVDPHSMLPLWIKFSNISTTQFVSWNASLLQMCLLLLSVWPNRTWKLSVTNVQRCTKIFSKQTLPPPPPPQKNLKESKNLDL